MTGGAGFIGHHIVEHFRINRPDWDLIILDRLTYAGRLERLRNWRNDPKVRFILHDFRAPLQDGLRSSLRNIDVVLHCGAETHVDRSIDDPESFVQSNVVGTFHMLQAARALGARFIQVSTDEVYGPAAVGVSHKEGDPYNPSNPYSATKAGAESLVKAWSKTYGLRVAITNTMNNFGERQHPEKFIPMVLRSILRAGDFVKIHTSPEGVIGSRKWLHARNHADGLMFVIDRGLEGQFNIAGDEYSNLEIAEMVARAAGKDKIPYRLVDFHSSRPGHDLRYSLDCSKLASLGWKPPVPFGESLERTVRWTLFHQEWLEV